MDYILIKRGSPEMEEIWDWLAKHPINDDLDNPSVADNNGHNWEYVGTYRNEKTFISEFRHRQHPKFNEPYIVRYEHSLNDESIQTSIKISK